MRAIFYALYLGAFTCMALGGDLVKCRSPNGKFAMLSTEAEDQGVSIELIEAGSKKVVLKLADTGHPYSEHSKLLWSPDSTRFAFFEDNRRGGSTTVYKRSGDGFEEVSLPETPTARIRTTLARNSGSVSSPSSG
jgi:hypothetical protein